MEATTKINALEAYRRLMQRAADSESRADASRDKNIRIRYRAKFLAYTGAACMVRDMAQEAVNRGEA
jgi:hypothetical protein